MKTTKTAAKTISTTERKRIAKRIADAQQHENDDYGNPEYIFSLTNNDLLLAIANGMVDAHWLAKKALANRGVDANGDWVGFDAAAQAWGVK